MSNPNIENAIPDEIKTFILTQKPYLVKYFQTPLLEPKYQLNRTKEKYLSVSCEWEDRNIRLSSLYNPKREVEKCLFDLDKKALAGTEIILLLGLGNPNLLDEILLLLEKKQICIAIDAHFSLGQLLCQQSPEMWRFLLKPGCHLFCGDNFSETLEIYINSLPIESFSGIKKIQHPPSIRLLSPYYSNVEANIHNLIKSRISNLLTHLEFESLWVKNIIINSQHIPAKTYPKSELYSIKAYKDNLKNIPGVLIASGPSLQESLDDLRELKERAFLLCADSACKVLQEVGIKPHGVMSLDAQIHSFFSFAGLDLEETIVFADIVSNPAIFRHNHLSKVIFSTTAQIISDFSGTTKEEYTIGYDFIKNIYGEMGSIQSGGSVATSAFDLLRYLGCDPILFIGLDQAYTYRKIHSTGTHHTRNWLSKISRKKNIMSIIEKIIHKRKTFLLSSILGKPILSDYILALYRQWFENSIPNCSQKIYQCSRNGATIDTLPNVKNISEIIHSLEKRKDLYQIFQKAPRLSHFHHFQTQDLIKNLNEIIHTDKNIEDILRKFPFIEYAKHKIELYKKRNKTTEKDNTTENYKIINNLKKLERSLRYLANT